MKNKFPWKILTVIILVVFILTGITFAITGDMVAKNSDRCVDTDDGLDIYNDGTCIEYYPDGRIKRTYEDKCTSSNSTSIREYYCNQRWFFDTPKCQQQTIVCHSNCILNGNNPSECTA